MHVGLIPDGHRRWAREHGKGLQQTYAIGFANGIDLISHLCELGTQCISVFALSADNYANRSPNELEAVIAQLVEGMDTAAPRLRGENIRTNIVGNIGDLSNEHRRALLDISSDLSQITFPRTEMNILVNYDMKWDFGVPFRDHETRNIPNCDLIFRSGGTRRLSGFLPKQSAYSELFFSKKLWPDVTRLDLSEVVCEFKATIRNFGA